MIERSARTALTMAGLCFAVACKRDNAPTSAAPEAANVVSKAPLEVEDPVLGMQLRLPPAWDRAPGDTSILDARRRPRPGTSFMVAPRIVVSKTTSEVELDREVARVLDELKALGERPGITVLQTLTGFRQAGKLELREISVHYEVGGTGAAGSGQGLVQRTFVGKHAGHDGKMYTLEITMSGLAEDQELLGTEVDTMLSGLSFAGVEVAAPPVDDAVNEPSVP